MIVHHSIEFSLFVFLAGVILGVVIVFMEDGLPKRKEVLLLCRILLNIDPRPVDSLTSLKKSYNPAYYAGYKTEDSHS